MDTHYKDFVEQALREELTGWDFSWLAARTEEEPLPWNYRQLVLQHMAGVHTLLDTGTGGGEILASLAPLPPVTWATEGYPPNVLVARSRLEPLGVRVADTSGGEPDLPFRSDTFDLVINRHMGLRWSEICRVLRPGGVFITQQVGGENCIEFNRFLEDEPRYGFSEWTLDEAIRQLQMAGLTIRRAEEYFPRWAFHDIAGVIFYLNAIPWQIVGFSVEAFQEKLYRLHQQIERDGQFVVHQHRLLLEAEKPA